MTRKSAGSSADSMGSLETVVAKELHAMIERGDFDSIGRLLSAAIASSNPAPSTALHLSFSLRLLDVRADGDSGKRIRTLGHLFVVGDKVDGENAPKIRFGISPSFVEDTDPCRNCNGTGVSPRSVKTHEQNSPKPFDTTFRTLTPL